MQRCTLLHLCSVTIAEKILSATIPSAGNWHIEQSLLDPYLLQFIERLALVESGASVNEAFKVNSAALLDGEEAELPYKTETVDGKNIAVFAFDGVMRLSDGLCSKGVSTFSNELRQAYADAAIDAIVIRANTPGGESHAGAELKNTLIDATKPVVILSHLLASGGVMGTLPADAIMAESEQSIIGSVGVMTDLSKYRIDAVRRDIISLYSRKSPDKNDTYRAIIEKGDTSKLIDFLTEADEAFMGEVLAWRDVKDSPQSNKKTLDGGMFFAEDAQRRGLIDGIATYNQALLLASKMAGSDGFKKRKRKNTKTKMTFDVKGLLAMITGKQEAEQEPQQPTVEAAEFNELKAAVEMLVTRQNENAAEILTLQNQVTSLTAKLEEKDAEIATLTASNAALVEQNEQLKTSLEQLKAEKNQIAAKIAAGESSAPVFKQEVAIDAAALEKKVNGFIRVAYSQ